MKTPLDLGSLKYTVVDAAFRDAICDCGDDIKRRPGLETKREVHLVMELVPDNPDGTGDVDTAHATFKVWSRIPKHETKVYSVGCQKDGSLTFNEGSPEDVNQGTLDEA